jgi:phage gp46-like protein
MAKNRYQGDPKVYLSEKGSYLKFKGGQPVMDAGLENRVTIPLFSRRRSKSNKKPWVGNLVFPNEAVRIGSDFEEGFDQPITISMLEDVQQRAEKALQSMIDTNLASEIIVTLTNPSGYRIDMNILVRRPNLPESELVSIRNGVNWIVQDQDPSEPDPVDPPDAAPDGFGAYEFGAEYFGTGY